MSGEGLRARFCPAAARRRGRGSRLSRRCAPALVALLASAAGCQHIDPRALSALESANALEGRSLADPALRAFLEGALETRLGVWPLVRWDLETLTLAALYFQPSVDVARAHAATAAAAIRTAEARPNPTLSVGPEWSANPDAGVASPWLAFLHLDWPIETAGKRGHRIDRASAVAASAREAIQTETVRLRQQLYAALVEVEAARARRATLEREVETLEHLTRLLEEQVEAGAASATDLAPIGFALLLATTELASVEAASAETSARLAEALGVPSPACEGLELVPVPVDSSPLLAIAREEALRIALLGRPDVRAGLDDYAAAEAMLRLELARQVPDVHVGTGYKFDQGQNKWELGLSLVLPLLDRNEGPIAEAEAARAEAAARFVATQAQAIAQVEQALARRTGALAQRERLRVLAADRAENLRRTRTALELGATDRASELAARLEELRAGRALIDADAGLAQALGDLEAALQTPLAVRVAADGGSRS